MDFTRNELRNVKSRLEKAEEPLESGNRKPYVKWMPEQRAKIGEGAQCKHGISSALKHFA